MDRTQLYSIGEVSKLFHISVSSLRHYEEIGLLKPKYISSDSGYRYYGFEQFEILNNLKYLRALGMPLNDISNFINNRDIDIIEDKLRQQKEIVQNKISELNRIEQKIEHRLNWIENLRSIELGLISVVTLPKTRIVWMDNKLRINEYVDMEKPIRELDKSSGESVVFLGKVGLGILPRNLKTQNTDYYDGIFLILDDEDIYNGDTKLLPSTKAVRLRFNGYHADAKPHYKRMLEYIEKRNLRITDFSRETTLIDYGLTNDKEKFVTEICIPVSVI